MKYRAEIDGLRALAIVPVVLYHAKPSTIGGGFLGVDVFFVISGYLITSIIFDEISKGSFSFLNFYERRIRRIFPALCFVVLACIPAAAVWLDPKDIRFFAKSVVAVFLFGSNIFFNQEISYFSPDIETIPLVHTWSLAVEEQFYVLFPVLLLLTKAWNPSARLVGIAIMSIASLCWAQYMSGIDPQSNFYLLPTRTWELGLGAACALLPAGFALRQQWMHELAAFSGLAMLAYSLFAFNQTMRLPNVSSLLPVGGTALLILFAAPTNSVGRLLSLKPLVILGLVSYSGYLWHQPLFAFARLASQTEPHIGVMLALCALTFALAYISWRFVEQPFRRKQRFSPRIIFASAAVMSIAFISVGRTTDIEAGFPGRSSEYTAIAKWEALSNSHTATCASNWQHLIAPESACEYNQGSSKSVAIWGDSHTDMISDELSKKLKSENWGLREFELAGCPPIVGITLLDAIFLSCQKHNDGVFKYIKNNSEFPIVVLFARWPLAFDGAHNDGTDEIREKSFAHAVPTGEDQDYLNNPQRFDRLGDIYQNHIRTLLSLGKKVVIVYTVPEIGFSVPRAFVHNMMRHDASGLQSLSIDLGLYRSRTEAIHRVFDLVPDSDNLVRVKPEDVFCNPTSANRCMAESQGAPLYFDDNHLNSIGAAMLSDAIVAAMKKKSWL